MESQLIQRAERYGHGGGHRPRCQRLGSPFRIGRVRIHRQRIGLAGRIRHRSRSSRRWRRSWSSESAVERSGIQGLQRPRQWRRHLLRSILSQFHCYPSDGGGQGFRNPSTTGLRSAQDQLTCGFLDDERKRNHLVDGRRQWTLAYHPGNITGDLVSHHFRLGRLPMSIVRNTAVTQ